MTLKYGITTDYEYAYDHKRDRIVVWSGPFFGTFEAEGLELPRHDGYMHTTYNGDKVRVQCPTPREAYNYEQVDRAINDALSAHYGEPS